jgi:dihydroxy-acid dehydratase
VLHVSPESWVGGPLALVKTGDIVELDVPGRKLTLKISDEEMAKRKAAWKPGKKKYERGYGKIFSQHVSQADKGCDFDFLEGTAPTPEPEIH